VSEHWRLILDNPAIGAQNMARDEAILSQIGTAAAPPTLRLYAWEPACLSLGYAQSGRDLDRERLAENGWQVVRRMTGGRAILHTNELTYSVALPLDHPFAAGGIIESYRRLSAALLEAVNTIGLNANADRHEATRAVKRPGPVCFELPSDYEITAGGKKLIGSAQVRRQHAMLQHGTLPLTGDIARICDALSAGDNAEREANRERVRARATTLSEALGRSVSYNEAADAIIHAFERCFDIQFTAGELSNAEATRAHDLASTRYAADAWTLRP